MWERGVCEREVYEEKRYMGERRYMRKVYGGEEVCGRREVYGERRYMGREGVWERGVWRGRTSEDDLKMI